MNIPSEQIAYKKQIGKAGGDAVWEVGTKGGLHLVVANRGSGKVETLGVGPHRAVARHIAKKREPKLNLTELSKHEHVEDQFIQHLIPKYEQTTTDMRRLQGYED